MGLTAGIIAIQNTEGKISAAIVLHGGGLLNTGRALFLGYDSIEKINDIISKGKLSFISVKTQTFIKDNAPQIFNSETSLLTYAAENQISNIYLYKKEWLMYLNKKSGFLEIAVLLPDFDKKLI